MSGVSLVRTLVRTSFYLEQKCRDGSASTVCMWPASSLAPTLLYAYLGSRYIPRENPGHAPQVLMLSVGSVSKEPRVQP